MAASAATAAASPASLVPPFSSRVWPPTLPSPPLLGSHPGVAAAGGSPPPRRKRLDAHARLLGHLVDLTGWTPLLGRLDGRKLRRTPASRSCSRSGSFSNLEGGCDFGVDGGEPANTSSIAAMTVAASSGGRAAPTSSAAISCFISSTFFLRVIIACFISAFSTRSSASSAFATVALASSSHLVAQLVLDLFEA